MLVVLGLVQEDWKRRLRSRRVRTVVGIEFWVLMMKKAWTGWWELWHIFM